MTLSRVQNDPITDRIHLDDIHSLFVSNVEHELRTPLTVIQGYAELLRAGDLGPLAPDQQSAVGLIVAHIHELRKIVERLGTLLAAEARTNVFTPVPLAGIVARVAEAKSAAAGAAGLHLRVSSVADLPQVSGDPYHLRQAVECLVENAIRFTPRGGAVDLSLYQEADRLCIAVADTGIGIAGQQLAQLFSGFYQADGSATRRYGGLGLGLTLAKAVVDAHHGQIEVDSQPGQGSRFVIKLPAAASATNTDRPDAALRPDSRTQRILVVDDDRSVAFTFQNALEQLPNCSVEVAASSQEALRLFALRPFNLLITDYRMPDVDGMTLAARVRQAYPNTAIVMITAFSTAQLREQAAQVQIRRVLDKPIGLGQIRDVAWDALASGVRQS